VRLRDNKLLMFLLTSVSMVGCNEVGSASNSLQEASVQESSQLKALANVKSGESAAIFTKVSLLDGGSESRVQHYGQKNVESADNYPGKRFGAGYSNIDLNEVGNLTLMYGGCNTDAEDECYNDTWLYNQQTNNWTWVGGESSVMNEEARISHPELLKYSFAPSAIEMYRYAYNRSSHEESATLNIDFVVYPEIHGIDKKLNFQHPRFYLGVDYKLLCDMLTPGGYPSKYVEWFSSLAGAKELCDSTHKSMTVETEFIYVDNKIGTAHEISLFLTMKNNMLVSTVYTGKEERTEMNQHTRRKYQNHVHTSFVDHVDNFYPMGPQSAHGSDVSRSFVSVRDYLPGFVNAPSKTEITDRSTKIGTSGVYVVGGDDDQDDLNGGLKMPLFERDFGTDHSGENPVSIIDYYRPMKVKFMSTQGATLKEYDSRKGLDGAELVKEMFDYPDNNSESGGIMKRSYASVPTNRVNPAVAISSDGRSLYFFGGLGMVAGFDTEFDFRKGDGILDSEITCYNDIQCYIYTHMRKSALLDFWRLDLDTGNYHRMKYNTVTEHRPVGRIGATMWESNGEIFLFGGSSFKYKTNYADSVGPDRTAVEGKCYFSDLWVLRGGDLIFRDGYWSLVSGEGNSCISSGSYSANYPASQVNAIVWENKSSGRWNILGGNNKLKGDLAAFLPDVSRTNGWDEHWEINLTPGGGGGAEVTMSLEPEKSVNQLWNGFDTLSSIPLGKFGLREVSFKVNGNQPAWGYSLNFKNSPSLVEFSIDQYRSSCSVDGQGEYDATLNNWIRNAGNNTYSCSYVLKFEPQTKSSSGIMSVDLLDPAGKVVDSATVPYSVR